MRVERCLDPHGSFCGVVGHLQVEVSVDLGFVHRIRPGQHVPDISEFLDETAALFAGHSPLPCDGPRTGEGFGAAGLHLGHPLRHQMRVGTGLQGCPVSRQDPVTILDRLRDGRRRRVEVMVGLGLVEGIDGLGNSVRGEAGAQPIIERAV
ncbi:hypothetical protein [Nocardia sp. CA-119907]|uniref:hypothetical protein n=1 Tax=Nocardia sp. CA-119907 TaxID=3239973 RepID=UPI003D9975B2